MDEWFRILVICCKTEGKPQIPSELGPLVRLTLTPEETEDGDYQQLCVELLLNIKVHYGIVHDVRSKYKQNGASYPPGCKKQPRSKSKVDLCHPHADRATFLQTRALNLGCTPRASKLLLSRRSAVSSSCRDVFHR